MTIKQEVQPKPKTEQEVKTQKAEEDKKTVYKNERPGDGYCGA